MSGERADVTALVLAGGRAQRLGGRKADRRLGAVRLLDRILEVARTVADEVLLLDGTRGLEAAGVRHVPDAEGVPGPLGGLLGGLAAAGPGPCLLLPCDQPFLAAPLLERLLERGRACGRDALLPVRDGVPQPFPAVVLPRALPALRAHAAAGGRSLTGALASLDAALLPLEDLAPGGAAGLLFDVDTPADLARARSGREP